MILYFSGTGNSKHIATLLSKKLNDDIISLNDRIKNNNYDPIISNERLILVCPTYSWRTPRIIDEYLRKVEIKGAKLMYFLMTCGGEIGNSTKYNKSLASSLYLTYRGSIDIIMPDNYIVMFKSPNPVEAKNLIFKAERRLDLIIDYIKENKLLIEPKRILYERLLSGCINDGFYKSLNKKKFHANKNCIKCGKCVELCPTNNIKLEKDGPIFLDKCIHCMKCLSYCPKNAIHYKNKTQKKVAYKIEDYL